MKKSFKKSILALAVAMVSTVAFAQDARSIVDAALNIKKPAYNHSIIEMDLINKAGNIEEHRIIDEVFKDETIVLKSKNYDLGQLKLE